MSEQRKPTQADCAGCYNDFYNGQGAEQCWHLKSATFIKARLIHVEKVPPYLSVPIKTVPSCYKMQRYVTVKPEALDKDGYWR